MATSSFVAARYHPTCLMAFMCVSLGVVQNHAHCCMAYEQSALVLCLTKFNFPVTDWQ